MTKEKIIEKFREKFVRHPAEIEGTKRVEWRQLATDYEAFGKIIY